MQKSANELKIESYMSEIGKETEMDFKKALSERGSRVEIKDLSEGDMLVCVKNAGEYRGGVFVVCQSEKDADSKSATREPVAIVSAGRNVGYPKEKLMDFYNTIRAVQRERNAALMAMRQGKILGR